MSRLVPLLCLLPAVVGVSPSQPGRCRPDPAGPPVEQRVFGDWRQSAYVLPFEPEAPRLVWRTTSHHVRGNGGVGLYAIDFELPMGTPVVAARAGVVVAVRDSFADGNNTDLEENFVMVRHADGTVARYLHLQQGGALVVLGDSVRQGQRVGRSGNSGQSPAPHLHFDVQACGPNLPPAYNRMPCGMTVPVAFRNTGPNPCGVEAGRRYVARPLEARPRQ